MRHLIPVFAAFAALAAPAAFAAPAAPAPAPASAAATYTFGAGSVVTYDLVHKMHAVKGTTNALEGKAAVADGKLVTPLTFKVPLRTFVSGNANRDANAYQALSVLRHPLATLDVQRFAETGRTKAGVATKITGTAHGTLTVRGVAKPAAIPLEAVVAPDALTVDARFPVSLTAHGIPRPALMFVPVEDAVDVVVHGVARP